MEGLERLRTKFKIDLHPSKLASASDGVRAHLSSLLLRYNEDLEGVVLSYGNERVLTHQASIHPYFPYVRVEVVADVVLFRPQPGMRLVGTVNKVGPDYLGLLVLGFMNAAVAADRIRPEFRAQLADHCWASSKVAAHRLEVGTKVHFVVAAVRRHGAFVSLAGSLQEPGTGAAGFAKLPKRGADAAVGSQKQQRGQRQQGQQGQQQHAEHEQPAEKEKRKKKKEKKRQRQEEPAVLAEQQAQQQAQHAAAAAAAAAAAEAAEAPLEAASGKKAKKAKRQQQQQQQQAAAPTPAAAAALAVPTEGSKKKKDKKRKAEDAGTPTADAAAATANGSAERQSKKKKKKQKVAA